MSIGAIMRSFLQHKFTVTLLVLEVAVTSAMACNVIHMATTKFQAIHVSSGLKESQLELINNIFLDTASSYVSAQANDLEILRHTPGVSEVAAVDSVPLSNNNWTISIGNRSPSEGSGVLRKPSIYTGTPKTLATLGLNLVAGRDFYDDEFQPVQSHDGYLGVTKVTSIIISKQLASTYFPNGHALGSNLYLPNGHPFRIVGIVESLLRPQIKQASDLSESVLLPLIPDQSSVTYVLRINTSDQEQVLTYAKAALARHNSRRIIESMLPFSQLRKNYFSADQDMLGLLCGTGAALIFVAILSIGGLANYWVLQRTTQIGIRRALGATKVDIRHYFQLENLLLVGAGSMLGIIIAPLLAHIMMTRFESSRLPSLYLPLVALLFCVVGQLSVLMPAMRASRIEPVVAIKGC